MAKKVELERIGGLYRRKPDPEIPVWGWIIMVIVGLGLLGQCAG